MSDKEREQNQSQVSVGAGIAVASIWLASVAAIVGGLMVLPGAVERVGNDDTTLILLVLIVMPLILAYWITKLILGRDT
jgi:hypothetical protein